MASPPPAPNSSFTGPKVCTRFFFFFINTTIMKYITLIAFVLLSIIVLNSCNCSPNPALPSTEYDAIFISTINFQTKTSSSTFLVELDECEYILIVSYESESLAHKGNCKYCAKRRKDLAAKELLHKNPTKLEEGDTYQYTD